MMRIEQRHPASLYEKQGSGRLFLALSQSFLSEQKNGDLHQMWFFVRALDNLSDSGVDPSHTKMILDNAVQIILALREKKCPPQSLIPEADSFIHSFLRLTDHQKKGVSHFLLEVIASFQMDLEIINTAKPFSQKKLNARHVQAVLSPLEALSYFLFHHSLRGRHNFPVELLFQNWAIFDALCDLTEDLAAGLILFSQEDIEAHQISFVPGEPIHGDLRSFFYAQRNQVARALRDGAKAIFETTISEPWSTFLWAYFFSKGLLFAKRQYDFDESIRFSSQQFIEEPHD